MIFALLVLLVVGGIITVAVMQSNANMKERNEMGGTNQSLNPQQYVNTYGTNGQPHLLVDVRSAGEFASGYIPGAVNIALPELPHRLNSLPKDQPIIVYCRSGSRSHSAAQMLTRAGFQEVYNLGGIGTWRAQGQPVETASPVH